MGREAGEGGDFKVRHLAGAARASLLLVVGFLQARMVELVYTGDLKSPARKGLRVRVPLLAPRIGHFPPEAVPPLAEKCRPERVVGSSPT